MELKEFKGLGYSRPWVSRWGLEGAHDIPLCLCLPPPPLMFGVNGIVE